MHTAPGFSMVIRQLVTSEDTTNVPVLEGDPLPEIAPIHILADGAGSPIVNIFIVNVNSITVA